MTDFLFYLFAIVVMGLSFMFLQRQRRVGAIARQPAVEADAARVGWQFEIEQTTMFEIYRWRGTTSGVVWIAEAMRSGRSRRTRVSSTQFVRWRTMRAVPVTGPVVMLAGDDEDEAPMPKLEGDGVVARLGSRVIAAVLDKGLDVRFSEEIGAQVDAATLESVADISRRFPGSTVMTAPAHQTSALFLFQKIEAPLRAAAASTPPLSLLIVPGGIAVSAKGWVRNVDELTPIVNAGVAIAQAIGESR